MKNKVKVAERLEAISKPLFHRFSAFVKRYAHCANPPAAQKTRADALEQFKIFTRCFAKRF
jgi:hypothetical protein